MQLTSRRWILLGAAGFLMFLGITTPWLHRESRHPSGGRAGAPRFTREAVPSADSTLPDGTSNHVEREATAGEPREPEAPKKQKKGGGPSRHDSEADALFTDLRVLRIEIDIEREDLDTLRGWHWRRASAPRPEVRATVRESGHTFSDVALQLKGSAGSFQSIDANPGLTLKFDKHVPDQRFHGLKKLSLNNSVQDPSFLCEKLCRELFTAAGVPAPRAAHAMVKLNGRDLGVRVLVEGFNKQFLHRHFSNTTGALFDSGFVQDITEDLTLNSGGGSTDYSTLERLREAASEPDIGLRLKKLEAILDMDRFLSFVALEVLICHWDGYAMNRNNYRLFHDLGSGRMVFLPHGLDQVFGAGRGSTSQPIFPRLRGLVAQAVLETPSGAERYLEALRSLYHDVLDPARMLRRADEIAEPIRRVLAEAEPDHLPSFLRHVQYLKDAIRERFASLEDQLRSSSQPGPPADSLPLGEWRLQMDVGHPEVAEEKGPEGQACLVIRARAAATVASWRAVQALPPGRYRFEGRARCEDVGGKGSLASPGACLRVDGSLPGRVLTGTRGWTALSHPFRVGRREASEVEFFCELRGDKGAVWFDKQSLRIVRE